MTTSGLTWTSVGSDQCAQRLEGFRVTDRGTGSGVALDQNPTIEVEENSGASVSKLAFLAIIWEISRKMDEIQMKLRY